VPPEERKKLRLELIREEFKELTEASDANDIVAVADALADLLYVVHGAALEWGIPMDPCYKEVHRSNMTKVFPDGTVHKREDGKVLKPPTYSPADLVTILKRFGMK
jgi:predicted HAD superfamily Cof-like phosphohydrolase